MNNERITRTIKVSCLSLHAIKVLHLDYFLAPIKLVPRHCTSAHLPASCNPDCFSAIYETCTATCVMLNKICTRTVKTRAIPSLHRDSFAAKVPGPDSYRDCLVLASGNWLSLQAGPSLSRHNMSGLYARSSLLPGRYA
jgi:hypothetical protein